MIAGGALIGAGVGGAYSALTGDGEILDSMLTGAGIGGLGGFGLSAAGLGSAATGSKLTAAEIAASQSPATFAYSAAGEMVPANYGASITGATNMPPAVHGAMYGPPVSAKPLTPNEKLGYGLGATTLLGMLGGQPEGVNVPTNQGMIRPYEYAASKREPEAGGRPYYFEPIQYDQFGKTTAPIDTSERNYFNQQFTPLPTYKAAAGGQVPQLNNMPAGGLAAIEGMRDGYGPMQTMAGNIPQFAMGGIPRLSNNKKMATVDEYIAAAQSGNMNSVVAKAKAGDYNAMIAINKIQETPNQNYAAGGFTNMQDGGFVVPADTVSHFGNGSTDAGLKLLSSRLGAKPIKGRGDGMSDSIPAMINGKQPARIADGEAYVPPEMVKKIGKGSPEAGAKRLYNMMDKVRHARTGTKKQGKQIKADKYLPT
jgi:hypothetical protein